MKQFLNDNKLRLQDNLYCEFLTKEKEFLNKDIFDQLTEKPNIILSHPEQIDKDTLKLIASKIECNLLVIEDKKSFISTIYDKSVILYNHESLIDYNSKIFDKVLRDLLFELGFLMYSKNVQVLIEVIKEAYNSPKLFYKLEDIYKVVALNHNVKSSKIRRDVIEAVNVMNNHASSNQLHTFFHTIGNETVTVKQCVSSIVEYLKFNN